jgi:hypothetical protein
MYIWLRWNIKLLKQYLCYVVQAVSAIFYLPITYSNNNKDLEARRWTHHVKLEYKR